MKRKPLHTYLKLSTEFYNFEQHPHHEQALKFYMDYAKKAQGPVLEPMCGAGRFLLPMLQADIDAEGFDASPFMLDAFKQQYACISSQEAPVSLQFVQDFTSSKKYSLVFIPYGSWGLLTDMSDVQQGLARLYDCLQPGGTLLVEIETIYSVPQPCGIWRSGSHARPDGSTLTLRFITAYNENTQMFHAHSIYESQVGGKVVEEQQELFEQYLYRCNEFDKMLVQAGFLHIKKYPAFDAMQKVAEDSPIIVYECVK